MKSLSILLVIVATITLAGNLLKEFNFVYFFYSMIAFFLSVALYYINKKEEISEINKK